MDVQEIDIAGMNADELRVLRNEQFGQQSNQFVKEFELILMQAIDCLLAKISILRHTDNTEGWILLGRGPDIVSYRWDENPIIHLGDTIFEVVEARGFEISGPFMRTTLKIKPNDSISVLPSHDKISEHYEMVMSFCYTSHDIKLTKLLSVDR